MVKRGSRYQHRDKVWGYDDLFSEEMATQLGQMLAERADSQFKQRLDDFKRAQAWTQAANAPFLETVSRPRLDKANKRVAEELAAIGHEENSQGASVPEEPRAVHVPLIPSPHSCVTNSYGYNSWGDHAGGGAGDATLSNGPGVWDLGGQIIYSHAGSGHVWGGSGCWFQVNPTPSAKLFVDFHSAAHCVLGGVPFSGYAHGHIALGGAVTNGSRWVDFGGVTVDLANVSTPVGSYWRDRDIRTEIVVPFDATAGGGFYCFGWFSMWGGTGGGFTCNVDLNTRFWPRGLTVCVP